MDELDRAIEWAVVRAIEKGSGRFTKVETGGYVWRLNSISPKFPPLIITFFYDEPNATLYFIALKKVTENL